MNLRRRRHLLYSFALVSIFALIWVNSRETKQRLQIRAIVNREIEKNQELAKSTSASTTSTTLKTKTEQLESLNCSPETCLLLIRKNLKCTSNHWEAKWLLNNTWIDKPHNIGFTLVPKCGSTSLRAIQFIISGFFSLDTNFARVQSSQMWPVELNKHHVERITDKYALDQVSNEMDFVTAIRDPISRLVSAYKDKIGRGSMKISRQWFWGLYGKHIITRYRNELFQYPELKQLGKNKLAPRNERDAIRQGLIPTFPEFVDYVIDTYPDHDAHWAPLTEQIDFCNLNYKYIFQVDKLNEQLHDIYQDLGSETLESISHIGGHQTNTASSSTEDYLEQLSQEQRDRLLQVYKNDYLAFESIYSSKHY